MAFVRPTQVDISNHSDTQIWVEMGVVLHPPKDPSCYKDLPQLYQSHPIHNVLGMCVLSLYFHIGMKFEILTKPTQKRNRQRSGNTL